MNVAVSQYTILLHRVIMCTLKDSCRVIPVSLLADGSCRRKDQSHRSADVQVTPGDHLLLGKNMYSQSFVGTV